MPRGLARTEPIGLWRVGASAAERVKAARRWAAKFLTEVTTLPPFHGDARTESGRTL